MRSYWPATSGPTPRQDQQPDTDSHDRVGAQMLLRVRTSIDARFPTRPTTPNAATADRRRLEQPSDTPDDQDRGRDRQVLQDEADEGPRTELYRSRGPLRRRLTRPGPRSNEDFRTRALPYPPRARRRHGVGRDRRARQLSTFLRDQTHPSRGPRLRLTPAKAGTQPPAPRALAERPAASACRRVVVWVMPCPSG